MLFCFLRSNQDACLRISGSPPSDSDNTPRWYHDQLNKQSSRHPALVVMMSAVKLGRQLVWKVMAEFHEAEANVLLWP